MMLHARMNTHFPSLSHGQPEIRMPLATNSQWRHKKWSDDRCLQKILISNCRNYQAARE